MRHLPALFLAGLLAISGFAPVQAQRPPRIFISVDMEGIGGIGTPAMTSPTGKDYALGRKLMTDEVNAVVGGILQRGPADILVNDSHGDMQNLLNAELDARVTYIQAPSPGCRGGPGARKPWHREAVDHR